MKLWTFPFEKEEKERETWMLAPDSSVIIEAVFSRHNLKSILAVQTLKIREESHEVVRYDSCHGALHRHLLFEYGDKREELGWPLTKETIHEIRDDLRKHWRERREKYLKRRVKRNGCEMESH